MSTPMGLAVGGGVSSEGMGGMAMAGMPAGGWSLAGATTFVALWTVMMAAMMLPAAAPMIVIFDSAQARGGETPVPTWIFIAGYLFVWMLAGIIVYAAVQTGSDVATELASLDRAQWAPLTLGATLLAAGLYQFTRIKHICLTRCRSPLAFVTSYWRSGRLGAL